MEVRKWWILICFVILEIRAEILPWSYECDEYRRCVKKNVPPENSVEGLSLGECKLTCDSYATLWPRPRESKLGKRVTPISLELIQLSNKDEIKSSETVKLLRKQIKEHTQLMGRKKVFSKAARPSGVLVNIHIQLNKNEDRPPRIRRFTNETYSLEISFDENEKEVNVRIEAECYFGARHALESLFQMVEYDPIRSTYIILSDVSIKDYPEYRHRGVSFDSSRNFMTVDVIKKIIDGMALDKLNVFHWHIVDTHSYAVEHKAHPINQMAQYGSYGPDKIYTQKDIKDIVAYANYKGVRVIPELDQPSHAGNGWQFPGGENATVCLNQEPFYDYCVEPPCGQLNPTEPKVYEILALLYKEWNEMFDFDTFHMGADEVHFGCWNSSDVITQWMEKKGIPRTKEGFIQLWTDFQEKSSNLLKESYRQANNNSGKDLEIIVWNSGLTKKEYVHNLPKETYSIQLWNNATDYNDLEIKHLVNKGYNLIFSNFDQTYLDCGYSAWVGEGNNWCTPYKGWQGIYTFNPYNVLKKHNVILTQKVKNQILGGEAAMWSEQVDSYHVEAKIFPRASALAERLWSNPEEKWYKAEQRMLEQRLRLTHRGVSPDALQPEWCRVNGGQCYVKDDYPKKEE